MRIPARGAPSGLLHHRAIETLALQNRYRPCSVRLTLDDTGAFRYTSSWMLHHARWNNFNQFCYKLPNYKMKLKCLGQHEARRPCFNQNWVMMVNSLFCHSFFFFFFCFRSCLSLHLWFSHRTWRVASLWKTEWKITCPNNELNCTVKSQSLFIMETFSYVWLHFTSFSKTYA